MSKIDIDFDNREYDSSDSKWLEDWMKAESEEIMIPESLEPEHIEKKLKGVKQKKGLLAWRKPVLTTAACLAVFGISLTAIQLEGNGKKKSFSSIREETVKFSEEAVESTEEIAEDSLEKAELDVSENNSYASSNSEKNSGSEDESAFDMVNGIVSIYGGATDFPEGNGSHAVEEGGYLYAAEDKQLVVASYDHENVRECNRIPMNQVIQEFQYVDGKLACISSDENGTTITVYRIENPEMPQSVLTVSVEGDYKCSYLEGDVLWVFTDSARVQRLHLVSGESNTFTLEELNERYFLAEDRIYGLTETTEGLAIQEYQVSTGVLKKGEFGTGKFNMDSILDIRKVGDNLELLVKKENAVTLVTYDERLRMIGEIANMADTSNYIGMFTEKGILTVCQKEDEAVINMMDEGSLKTVSSKLLKGVQVLGTGRLWLSDERSWIGLAEYPEPGGEGTYQVYQYDEENGFTEVKSSSVKKEMQLDEVVSKEAVINREAGEWKVLVE